MFQTYFHMLVCKASFRCAFLLFSSRSSKSISTLTSPTVASNRKRWLKTEVDAHGNTFNALNLQTSNDSASKLAARLSFPFHDIKDITYAFQPFLCHQQHMDEYRQAVCGRKGRFTRKGVQPKFFVTSRNILKINLFTEQILPVLNDSFWETFF